MPSIPAQIDMLLDLKLLKATLAQIEEEKKIPQEALIDAIAQSLAAAYKKDYGKRGQIVRCMFNVETGDADFVQVKTVVDETTVRPALKEGEAEDPIIDDGMEDPKPRFDEEKHMLIADAKIMKPDAELGDEIIFPLDRPEEDFGRVAAQTAKQVIIQRLRDAERAGVLNEFSGREGTIITGIVQKVERGTVVIEFQRTIGFLPRTEQIPGEHFRTGDRIKAYLYAVEDGPRGINLRLSRSHPRFIEMLFAMESPEIASGIVEIRAIVREAGSRSKMAVVSHDEQVDAIGSCVGQKGTRVRTITSELHDEKIDIIQWSPDVAEYIGNSLSPAVPIDVTVDEEEHIAHVTVPDDKLSLAIGKGGENVRLAAKLTGWKIDIKSISGEEVDENGEPLNKDAFKKAIDAVITEAELLDADGNLDNNAEFAPSDEVAEVATEETPAQSEAVEPEVTAEEKTEEEAA
jgi:transcription termination/antitermination protein NusA